MKNGFDPDWGIWFNVAFIVLGLLAGGSLVFPGVPDIIVSAVKGYAADGVALIGALNLVFHFFSSAVAGPGVANK